MPSNQIVSRFYGAARTTCPPVNEAGTIVWAPQLVFEPGFFSYNGLVYDLRLPGLYVLYNPMINTTKMIIAGGDPVALLSAASWMTTFGDDDGRQPGETVSSFLARVATKARGSKLNMLCGNTIEFTQGAVFAGSGIPTRTVRFVTMDTPNNVVDGHIVVEAMVGGSWALADVSLNVMFRSAAGARLSASDAVQAIAADAWQYEMLAEDGYAVEPANSYQFDSTGYAEAYLLTPQDRRDWHRRIFQAVGIDRLDPDGVTRTYWKLPPGAEGRKEWLEGLSTLWKVMTPEAWGAAFYP